MLVHLKMLVDELVLVVLISVRIVLQKCMGCLEMRVDGWGLFIVVGVIGFLWDVVGGGWFGGG